jgi:hypothetical protein
MHHCPGAAVWPVNNTCIEPVCGNWPVISAGSVTRVTIELIGCGRAFGCGAGQAVITRYCAVLRVIKGIEQARDPAS